MLNPWVLLIAILSIIAAFIAGDIYGHKTATESCKADADKAKVAAIQMAIETERSQQEKVNAILKKQNDDLSSINSTLRADIDRLRSRKARPVTMPEAPRPSCEGTTGAELYREDTLFLSGEAARADRLRSALAACYEYADTVGGQAK